MGKRLLLLIIMAGMILFASPAMATVHSWTEAAASFTFDDWGFTGPQGRGYNDFAPTNGFGANTLDPTGGIGQIQHVYTAAGDKLTSDPASPPYPETSGLNYFIHDSWPDFLRPTYSANMDSITNFYKWAYTSPAGSKFNNMQIDYDGDYYVPAQDMSFGYYGLLEYTDTTGTYDDWSEPTNMQFQPWAISDGIGWCGSVLAEHPLALEAMAGQISFDFAFDVYDDFGSNQLQTQYVPGFVMRSYGTLTIDDGYGQTFEASAVVNNTNPLLGDKTVGPDTPVDVDFYNKVSFMGGGLVPEGAWLIKWWVDVNGVHVDADDPTAVGVDTSKTIVVDETTPGAVWHQNGFAGKTFLLRADADRTVEYFDEAYYGPAPTVVPEPGSILLLGSGLLGLIALKRGRRF